MQSHLFGPFLKNIFSNSPGRCALIMSASQLLDELRPALQRQVEYAAAQRAIRLKRMEADRKKTNIKDLLAAADRGALGSLFQIWDADGSGYLDREEFGERVTSLCQENHVEYSVSLLDELWKDYDNDASGCITYDEWMRVSLRDQLAQDGERVMDAFRRWDQSGDGQIDRAEFLRAVQKLGVAAPSSLIEDVFDGFDVDGSGTLAFTELHKQLRHGSTITLRNKRLLDGQVHFERTGESAHALRRGSLVQQMKRHIATPPDPSADVSLDAGQAAARAAARPAHRSAGSVAAKPARVHSEPPSTSLWVLQQLAQVGPRKLATIRHTALRDDHSSMAAAQQRLRSHAGAERASAAAGMQRRRPAVPPNLLDLLATSDARRQPSRATEGRKGVVRLQQPPTSSPVLARPAPSTSRVASQLALPLSGSASASILPAGTAAAAATSGVALTRAHSTPALFAHRPAPFIVRDPRKATTVQDLRCKLARDRSAEQLLGKSPLLPMARIDRLVGPSICLHVRS